MTTPRTTFQPRIAGLAPDAPAWAGPAFDLTEFERGDLAHVGAVRDRGGFPRLPIGRDRRDGQTQRRA